MRTRFTKIAMAAGLMLAMALTFSACSSDDDGVVFPSEFSGTWKRVDQSVYTNTLNFTENTIKASNQSSFWNLKEISGDAYTLESSNNSNYTPTIIIKLINDSLEITNDPGTGIDNWNGNWWK